MSADVADLVGDVLDGRIAVEEAFAVELAGTALEDRAVLLAALRSVCGAAHRARLAQRGMDDGMVRAAVARTVRGLLAA